MLAVVEAAVGPQRAEERLLERVVGSVAPELAAQQPSTSERCSA